MGLLERTSFSKSSSFFALFLAKYLPLSLGFGLRLDDDPDPGLLWSVRREVTPPPP